MRSPETKPLFCFFSFSCLPFKTTNFYVLQHVFRYLTCMYLIFLVPLQDFCGLVPRAGERREPDDIPQEPTGETRVETRVETRGENTLKTREKILQLVKSSPTITIPEISARLGISSKGVEWQVSKLKAEGILRRIGPNKGGHWEVVE